MKSRSDKPSRGTRTPRDRTQPMQFSRDLDSAQLWMNVAIPAENAPAVVIYDFDPPLFIKAEGAIAPRFGTLSDNWQDAWFSRMPNGVAVAYPFVAYFDVLLCQLAKIGLAYAHACVGAEAFSEVFVRDIARGLGDDVARQFVGGASPDTPVAGFGRDAEYALGAFLRGDLLCVAIDLVIYSGKSLLPRYEVVVGRLKTGATRL